MNLARRETSFARRRLSGQLQQRGCKSGFSTVGAFLFGGVFLAAGTAIILVGTKILPVDPATVHAPYWVLTAAGVVFFFGGIMVCSLAWRQFAANQQAQIAAREFPNEPALQDYKWNPKKFAPPRWWPVITSVCGVVFLALFLSMFNWWVFLDNGPWPLKAMVSLFDLFLLFFVYQAALKIMHAAKFGGSQIQFTEFPYSIEKPVNLRWRPATGISRVNKGSFTLRCIEEFWEATGSVNDDRSGYLVHEEIWSETKFCDEALMLQPDEEIPLHFEIPTTIPATSLSADRPIFWELEVKLDLPGLDFKERYLIPVYAHAK